MAIFDEKIEIRERCKGVMGWHRLIEDAEREKKEDHPLRTKEGHHILELSLIHI